MNLKTTLGAKAFSFLDKRNFFRQIYHTDTSAYFLPEFGCPCFPGRADSEPSTDFISKRYEPFFSLSNTEVVYIEPVCESKRKQV